MISIETIAYTAGLIDGEGSIQINPSKNKKHTAKSWWSLTVQVSSGCEEVLRQLRDEWGVGSVTTWKPKGKKLSEIVQLANILC